MAAGRLRDGQVPARRGRAPAHTDPPPCATSSPTGAPTGAAAGLPGAALLVLAALAAAFFGQGAYYGSAQTVVAVLLAVAGLAAVAAGGLRPSAAERPLVVAGVRLGTWAVVRAVAAGDPSSALGILALLAGVVAVAMAAHRCDTEQRGQLLIALVVLGVLVVLTGWAGVAWRTSPWALQDQGLWRAATTVTYANAASILLAAVALVSRARSAAAAASSPLDAAANSVLLTGLTATLSRGGSMAFLAGALVLARLLGFRTFGTRTVPPAAGAAVALAGLLPSMPSSSPPRPLLAASMLLLGSLVAVAATRLRAGVLLPVVLAGVCLFAVTDGRRVLDAGQEVARPRLTTASPDRRDEARAALRLARSRPVVGVGPARAELRWARADGSVAMGRYAHNEYLQVLAELGVVGLAILLSSFVVIGRVVRAGRATSAPGLWAGVAAALVALAVHGLFDFSWHVPAIPLTGALLLGIVTTNKRKEPQ